VVDGNHEAIRRRRRRRQDGLHVGRAALHHHHASRRGGDTGPRGYAAGVKAGGRETAEERRRFRPVPGAEEGEGPGGTDRDPEAGGGEPRPEEREPAGQGREGLVQERADPAAQGDAGGSQDARDRRVGTA